MIAALLTAARVAALALLTGIAAAGSLTPHGTLAAGAGTVHPGVRIVQVAVRPASRPVNLTHRRVVRLSIKNLRFSPARVVVSRGTLVVWTNGDSFQHAVTSDTGIWNSGPLDPTAPFRRVFGKTGTFPYHCTIHPFMHGSITVT